MRTYFETLGIKCIQLGLSLKGLIALGNYLKIQKFSIIHTHLIHADILGRIAALMSNNHSIVFTTVHGTEWFRREKQFYPFIIRKIDRWLSQPRNHFIIAISESVRHVLIKNEKINPEKITLLYNAVQVHRPATRQTRDNLKVLYLGRLSAEKNVACLIQAMEQLKSFKMSLTIVGNGEEKDFLLTLVKRLELEAVVAFVDGKFDVDDFYQSHDVLVLPSQHEGLGIVILEAFSHAMPVIGSNIEGIGELLRDGRGLLFENSNSSSLAQKLSWANSHREALSDLGKKGYEYVIKYHNIEDYVNRLIYLYKKMKNAI